MYFDFKQFRIYHDRCAMKVGTDGVLLGAWPPFDNPNNISNSQYNPQHPSKWRMLDIGTGSGLLALMLAQRYPTAYITAIEIDSEASSQARDNVLASSFADRISVQNTSLQEYTSTWENGEPGFNSIICNPPFFENSLLAPNVQRAKARHATTLPFEELIAASACLLVHEGQFAVILPIETFTSFHHLCFSAGLNLEAECKIQTTLAKSPKRILACFRKGSIKEVRHEHLILTVNGQCSNDYSALTRDFYIR